MKKFLLFLVLASFLSCDEKPQAQAAVETETASLSDTLQVQTNRQVTLQPEAQEKVSDWLAYATAHNQVEDMRSATGRDLVSNSQPVVQIMEALSSSLPDSLQQVPVRARISVLVTKANVLHQTATKKEVKAQEVFNAANDIILEFDNFKLQLNELFLKTPADFEIELDRQFEESQDSLRRIRQTQDDENKVAPLGRE